MSVLLFKMPKKKSTRQSSKSSTSSTCTTNKEKASKPVYLGEYLDSIPNFSGASGDITFADFYDRINLIAKHENWSNDDILLVIRLKLTEDAARFVRDNPNLKKETELDVIVGAIKDRFCTPEFVHQNLRNLLQSYQRPHESVRVYAARLEASSYKAVPQDLLHNKAANALRLDVLTSVFIEGLRPSIRRLVLPQSHKDFASARKHAICEEEIWMKQHPDESEEVCAISSGQNLELQKMIKQQQEQISTLTDSISALKLEINEATAASGTSKDHIGRPFKQTGPRCFICNRFGHISRNCNLRLEQREQPPQKSYQSYNVSRPPSNRGRFDRNRQNYTAPFNSRGRNEESNFRKN